MARSVHDEFASYRSIEFMNFPAYIEFSNHHRQSRLSVFFRLLLVLPALLILKILAFATSLTHVLAGLTILFFGKYPRWLFDFNLSSCRFEFRCFAYLLLLTDEYPTMSTDAEVIVEIDYPDDEAELARLLPLLKWLLVIPHSIVLALLFNLLWLITPICWFIMLVSGRYPHGFFDFTKGILQWWLRVHAYAFILATDQYPPFSLMD